MSQDSIPEYSVEVVIGEEADRARDLDTIKSYVETTMNEVRFCEAQSRRDRCFVYEKMESLPRRRVNRRKRRLLFQISHKLNQINQEYRDLIPIGDTAVCLLMTGGLAGEAIDLVEELLHKFLNSIRNHKRAMRIYSKTQQNN